MADRTFPAETAPYWVQREMPSERGEELVGGRYALGEGIGRGGMADVYRATDRVLSREVAVKVLRDRAEDTNTRERFTAEARTLARLSHTGLVMILDAGIDAEQPYLVMQLVEGSTLAALIAEGPVAASEAARIGTQVAAALAYAHAHGVIHRDVKPGNVLLGTDGQVKLADFGIARLIGDTMRHTNTGQAIGTPAYLAPEQVRGHEITPAADVYALGLVLLEMLTGERAYPGAPVEAAIARLSAPPPIPGELSQGWRSLLAEATALEPADRPDAATVAERLRVLTAPAPLLEPTMPLPIQPGRPWADWLHARPHTQRWVAAAIATIAILVAIASFTVDGNSPSTASAESDTRAPSAEPRYQKGGSLSPTPSAPQASDVVRPTDVKKVTEPPKTRAKPPKDTQPHKKAKSGKEGNSKGKGRGNATGKR